MSNGTYLFRGPIVYKFIEIHRKIDNFIEARDSERDIWSLCAMGWGSGWIGELSARRRRRHLEI